MGAMTPRNLLIAAIACAIVGLLVLPAVSPETGATADALFIVQGVVLLAGAAFLVFSIVKWRAVKRSV